MLRVLGMLFLFLLQQLISVIKEFYLKSFVDVFLLILLAKISFSIQFILLLLLAYQYLSAIYFFRFNYPLRYSSSSQFGNQSPS